MAQLNNQLAERELIKKFQSDPSWLSELRAKNNWVGNDVIKIPRQGTAPTVLINNTVYPISSNNREDDFIAVSLHKYDTTNTTVSDDELYALAYEKLNDVQLQHREELDAKTAAHALHALAVPAHTAVTPVLETTGPDDGTGRRRLITQDLINYRKALSDLNVPLKGRVLVLSNEHEADLMTEDSNRAKSWGADFQSGAVGVQHVGFKLYTSTDAPYYDLAENEDDEMVWTKQAFGAVTGRQASVLFFAPNAVKATGTVKRYARLAENDPENRKNTLGFRLWFIAVGIKDEGFGAIVSADV